MEQEGRQQAGHVQGRSVHPRHKHKEHRKDGQAELDVELGDIVVA